MKYRLFPKASSKENLVVEAQSIPVVPLNGFGSPKMSWTSTNCGANSSPDLKIPPLVAPIELQDV
jgi:hypothetical protein